MSPGRPLLLMIPGLVLVLAATVEAWMLIRRGRRYDWKSFGVSLVDMLGRGLVHRLLGGGIAVLLHVRLAGPDGRMGDGSCLATGRADCRP